MAVVPPVQGERGERTKGFLNKIHPIQWLAFRSLLSFCIVRHNGTQQWTSDICDIFWRSVTQ